MLKLAVENLLSRKVRTSLALLGLTVAILGMVGLFSVAEGLDATVSESLERVPGLLAVQPGAPFPLFSAVPAGWQAEIADTRGVSVVNPQIWQRANLVDGETVTSPPRIVFGMDLPSRLALQRDVYLESMVPADEGGGRYFRADDVGTANVVVSRPIAEAYDKRVGDTLEVNGFDTRIVGIYHTRSMLLDISILMDVALARRISQFNPTRVSCFYLELEDGADDQTVIRRLEERFRGRGRAAVLPGADWENPLQGVARLVDRLLKPAADREPDPSLARASDALGLEVRNANDLQETVDEFSRDLDVFLMLMTGLGVTIAVLGITNTMLMSVSERIIEFGVLKANGWRRVDVLRLVTFESAALGFVGGLLGSLLGWVGTLIVNQVMADRIELFASPRLLVFSMIFSTVLGVLAGVYPAVWAMRLPPMDAIRRG